uniref:NADH-ubiquinone oxidoreductase chain 6 n=1 Tax=Tagasta indica TaxID=281095 RepID=A0A6C0PSN6_9ORTH|nr:NADH dehydrogenase subunit 6 [Tagasta indica]YP_010892337.1 NADH dehydrogenase subunit 6 [Tagasta tonkinensis]QHX99921.1 NADH dehydrogenase subunit 6 [Tagasta indica]WJO90070.1 NADH dehydrogenase subunit 6 [Tagasta tonkinensis]
MLKTLIMSTSSSININFMKFNHPMSMLLTIIIQTIFISIIMGNLMESFWLSYILFLTFLGGMMVLFVYITSIASNELFNLNLNYVIITIMMMVITFSIMIITEYSLVNDIFKNSETFMLNFNIDTQEMSYSLMKTYNYPSFLITLMMMMYLFLTLVVVVKITNINQGPIRKFN